MLKQKKAAVEIQFHWIYVMLVGAALLIFFSTAIYQQQKISREKREREMLNSLEAAMRSVHSHSGLSERIDARIDLKRDCATASIRAGTAAKQSGTDPIFSPKELKGTSLALGTISWNTAFRASNFLLMSTDEEHFIIWHDSSNPESAALFEKIKKEWPKDIPYSTTPEDRNAKTTHVIALNADYPTTRFSGKVIKIKVNSLQYDNFEKGTIQFEESPTLEYAGLAAVLGAAFSDSREEYDCSMENAYGRLSAVAEIYEKKAVILSNEPTLANCKDATGRNYYSSAELALAAMREAARSKDALQIYDQAINQLKPLNNELLKKSCPVIY